MGKDDFVSVASPVLTHPGHGQGQEAADLTHKESLEVTEALPVPQGIWETLWWLESLLFCYSNRGV